MILKRFYDDKLAQASYLVGCAATGEACVIDPNRDIDPYIVAAAEEGLRIVAVTETHIHADYVSGSRELGHRTGATLFLSDEGDADWKYAFADEPNVRLVRHGDTIRIGNVRLDVVKTPGHTPEHIAFILTDEPATSMPLGAFTGDFVFVGDVGRPDLLERAAGFEGTMEAGARVLFESIQRFKRDYPDTLLVWPAHGSGSACGKALGGVPVSTLGYEKASNWGLRASGEENFVREVLSGQPEPPAYFKEMKRINKLGPAILGGFHRPPRLGAETILSHLEDGSIIVDLRPSAEYQAAFIPGTVNIPEDRSFSRWAGSLLPFDRPIYLLAEHEEAVVEAVRDLAMIGLDRVDGWFGLEVLQTFEALGRRLESVGQIGIEEALRQIESGEAFLLDVRGAVEVEEGRIPGSRHIALGSLPSRAGELPRDRTIVVHCHAGSRAAIGASLLRALGFDRVATLWGGYEQYAAHGLPVETSTR